MILIFLIIHIQIIKLIYLKIFFIKNGIGDWGLGIGDWGLGPIPNPQYPIPNPQSPFIFLLKCFFHKNINFGNNYYILKEI